jgi:hypothetical protein
MPVYQSAQLRTTYSPSLEILSPPPTDSVAAEQLLYRSGTSLNNDQGDAKVDYNISTRTTHFSAIQAHLRNPSFTGCVFALPDQAWAPISP